MILLGLQVQEQQDPQEFSKLFLAKIEGLKLSVRDESKKSLQQLMVGSEEFKTICLKCTGAGNGGGPTFDYHELELSISEQTSLEGALHAYLAEELLGDDF